LGLNRKLDHQLRYIFSAIFKSINKHITTMNKTLIVLLALFAAASCSFLRTHDYWYTASKAIVKTGAPFSDVAWNYCDLKCLYFEKYAIDTDFVFVVFSGGIFSANFGACYTVKKDTSKTPAVDVYTLWNKVDQVKGNTWYQKYCGDDKEDYIAAVNTDGKPKYTVVSTEGVGIKNEVIY
jgi:hypothetical protein